MNEPKSQFNLRNGIVAGISAFAGMMLARMFFDEQSALTKGLLSVVMAVLIALSLDFTLKALRKFKG